MLYYAIGPVVAFIISIKFTDYSTMKRSSEIKLLEAKVEQLEQSIDAKDKEMLEKVFTTVIPVTKAVRELQNTVGLS